MFACWKSEFQSLLRFSEVRKRVSEWVRSGTGDAVFWVRINFYMKIHCYDLHLPWYSLVAVILFSLLPLRNIVVYGISHILWPNKCDVGWWKWHTLFMFMKSTTVIILNITENSFVPFNVHHAANCELPQQCNVMIMVIDWVTHSLIRMQPVFQTKVIVDNKLKWFDCWHRLPFISNVKTMPTQACNTHINNIAPNYFQKGIKLEFHSKQFPFVSKSLSIHLQRPINFVWLPLSLLLSVQSRVW